jgi:hypothetical protein
MFKNNSQVLCDIEISDTAQIWNLWRISENESRVLTMTVAAEDGNTSLVPNTLLNT